MSRTAVARILVVLVVVLAIGTTVAGAKSGCDLTSGFKWSSKC